VTSFPESNDEIALPSLVQLQIGNNPGITKVPFSFKNATNLKAFDMGNTGIRVEDVKWGNKMI